MQQLNIFTWKKKIFLCVSVHFIINSGGEVTSRNIEWTETIPKFKFIYKENFRDINRFRSYIGIKVKKSIINRNAKVTQNYKSFYFI